MNVIEAKKLLALKEEMRKNNKEGKKSLPYKGCKKSQSVNKKVYRQQGR